MIEKNIKVNSDSWSIGVLQYWMKYSKMPEFDLHNNLIVPFKGKESKQEVISLTSLIEKNPTKRKQLFPPVLDIDSSQDGEVFEENFIPSPNMKNNPRKYSEPI